MIDPGLRDLPEICRKWAAARLTHKSGAGARVSEIGTGAIGGGADVTTRPACKGGFDHLPKYVSKIKRG